MFAYYGTGRWYLNVDVDEFLSFPQKYGRKLVALIANLEHLGEKHLLAPMLDMLPSENSPLSRWPPQQIDALIGECPNYVATDYTMIKKSRSVQITGGQRVIFGHDLVLTKYPLLWVDGLTNLAFSIHEPMPYWRNHVPPRAALLHFRYAGDFREKYQDAVEDSQYFQNSRFYADGLQRLSASGESVFDIAGIMRWNNVEQLLEQGFVG